MGPLPREHGKMDDVEKQKEEADFQMKKQIMKAQAIRTSIFEVLKENQAEIVKRSREKLLAMGMNVDEGELSGAELSKLP